MSAHRKKKKSYYYFFYLFAFISFDFGIAHLHVKSIMSCCCAGSGRLGALCSIKVRLLLLRVSQTLWRSGGGAEDRLTYWGGGAGDSYNSPKLMQLVG